MEEDTSIIEDKKNIRGGGTLEEIIENINDFQTIVIMGANGAGKTRSSIKIQKKLQNQGKEVIRIAAQKKLAMSDRFSLINTIEGESKLHYGVLQKPIAGKDKQTRTQHNKWQNKPTTHIQDDFQDLIDLLFSKHFNFLNLHSGKIHTHEKTDEQSILNKLVDTYNVISKKNQLIIDDMSLKIKNNSNPPYMASEGSDGERAFIYLIGQCFLAPPESFIIIDEPEQHIHQGNLELFYDKLECIRQDCKFIYLTHNLPFAVSRIDGKKIWIQDYDGENFNFINIINTQDIPEEAIFELLGARRPILFIEGEKTSIDYLCYKSFYKDHKIFPSGSCENVIKFTKAIKSLMEKERLLHHLKVFGILDKDHRNENEIGNLKENGIFVLPFTELENIFLSEKLLRKIFEKDEHEDAEVSSTMLKIKEMVFSCLVNQKDSLVDKKVQAVIRYHLKSIDFEASSLTTQNIKKSLTDEIDNLKVEHLRSKFSLEIYDIIKEKKYDEALKIIDNKGLYKGVAAHQKSFKNYHERLIKFMKNHSDVFKEVIQDIFPSL